MISLSNATKGGNNETFYSVCFYFDGSIYAAYWNYGLYEIEPNSFSIVNSIALYKPDSVFVQNNIAFVAEQEPVQI